MSATFCFDFEVLHTQNRIMNPVTLSSINMHLKYFHINYDISGIMI
jgi:hypothetical protein